jgi:hypothetical protein
MFRLLALSFIWWLLTVPSSAYEQAGFCRDCPCDEKLLNDLKSKYSQKIQAYRQIVAAAEETRQREAEAIKTAQDVFGEYTKDIATDGATTVGEKVYPVPFEIYEKYKKYTQMTTEPSSTEDLLKLSKLYLEELAKGAGYENALERTKWVDSAISGIAMDMKVLTSLKEADFHAEQAFKQWLLGYEALMDARRLQDKIKKLEAQCKKEPDSSPPAAESEDQGPSGEREAVKARELVKKWKSIDGEFRSSEGSITSEQAAFEEALAIVQDNPSSWWNPQPQLLLVATSEATAYKKEWRKFRAPMIRAYRYLQRALDAFHRAEAKFKALEKP